MFCIGAWLQDLPLRNRTLSQAEQNTETALQAAEGFSDN
jgi:hypothetical protein